MVRIVPQTLSLKKTHTFIASTLTYDFHISFLAFIYLNQYIVFLNTRQSVGTHIRANFQTLYYLTPPRISSTNCSGDNISLTHYAP